MAIKGPKGAQPTLRGWVNPKTGELLKSQRIPQEAIDDFFGVTPEPVATPAQVEPIPPLTKTDCGCEDCDCDPCLCTMTKFQIETFGRTQGIEIDRRKSKASMIEELKAFMNA